MQFTTNLLSPQPQNGQQVVGQNIANGIQQEQAQNNVPYYIQNQLAQNLIKQKQAYADAMAQGDAAGMEAAHQGAEAYRNFANSIGFNADDYGSGVSLAQANANADIQNMRNYNDLLNTHNLSSGEYYQQKFDEYRQQGLTRGGADKYAAQDAERYQRERLQNLKDRFYTIGVDPMGNVNQHGTQLMDAIYDESPEALSLITQTLPMYSAEYIRRSGEVAKDNAMNRNLTMLAQQYADSIGMNNNQTDNAIRANNANILAQGSLQSALAKLNTDERIRLVTTLGALGIPPDALQDIAGSEKTSNSSSNDVKMSASQEKFYNQYNTLMGKLQESIKRTGNYNTDEKLRKESGAYLDELNDLLEQIEADGSFSPDEVKELKYKAYELANKRQINWGRKQNQFSNE